MGFSKNPLLDPKIQDGGDPPSWMLTPNVKTRFSGKLSNLVHVSCNWAFQRNHYWTPKVQDG